ncbi:tetratricopeptide repeat protein [Acidovorax sp. BL-A-41-H1]|uniref:tetratricopeptide repeat protein n=1 Tax=Acidovorax sp. BL-A-41-H1 TaxID=3421102 RepID=UPI003F79A370
MSDPNLLLIESARVLIDQGQLTEAADVLNKARAQIPNDPRVYMMAGVMSEKAGNVAGAFQLMRTGLELAPNWAPGIVVLAQLQARQGQLAEAKENAATALQLDAESGMVRDGAIDVAHHMMDVNLAVSLLQDGLKLQPTNAKWRLLLANDLSHLERYDEALALWDGLIAESPHDEKALTGRMHTLLAAGRLNEAAAMTATLLALDPANAVYAYYDARAKGQTPTHQPAELNRKLFDTAAHIFDQQLVQGLRYQLPEQIARKLVALHPDKKIRLLDLGCGTGLLGARLGKLDGRLDGVDVSPKMLEQASRLKLYDSLKEADLHDTLRQAEAESYDVIAALEVCVYVGDLTEAVPAAWRVLAPGGRLIFSCEIGPEDGPDLFLNPTTERYVHKRSHVEGVCRAAGFSVDSENTVLRYQKGQPVHGFVITAQKIA